LYRRLFSDIFELLLEETRKSTLEPLDNSQQKIIHALKEHVKQAMPPDPTGHDWPHVWRVLKNALKINETEKGDEFQITLIALTHDLYDHKFFTGTQDEAEKNLYDLLMQVGVDAKTTPLVVDQVFNLSFKGGAPPKKPLSKEGQIVQDADRLEAIGAIGIARAFAFGGFKNRMMNHAEKKDHLHDPAPLRETTTFDHFFEKLLKLYDLLNTQKAKSLAKDRFMFMEEFVKRFGEEWG
jgi:uncharacterized protein